MPYALCLGVRYDVRSAFFFTDMPPTFIYTLSLHDALPICQVRLGDRPGGGGDPAHPQRWADLPDQLRWWRRAACRGLGARRDRDPARAQPLPRGDGPLHVRSVAWGYRLDHRPAAGSLRSAAGMFS